MTWMLRPILPTGVSFDGEIVFNSTDYEVDDFFKYIENIDFSILPQYEIKQTGLEKNKYKKTDSSTMEISIQLTGNIPRWLFQQLYNLAIAVNGSGMIVEYQDQFVNGTFTTSVLYNCRWLNAGDFVENNVLLYGGSIDLISYTLPEEEGRYAVPGIPDAGVFEETIAAPASGTEWNEVIDDADADDVYFEVI